MTVSESKESIKLQQQEEALASKEKPFEPAVIQTIERKVSGKAPSVPNKLIVHPEGQTDEFLNNFPVAKELTQYPNNDTEWFNHYRLELEKHGKIIIDQLLAKLNGNHREMMKFLCAKGYFDACVFASQIRSYPSVEYNNLDEIQKTAADEKFKLSLRACEKWSLQSCKQLFYLSKQYSLENQKLIKKLITQHCRAQWGQACELLALIYQKEGDHEKAIKIAKSACDQFRNCGAMATLMESSDPSLAGDYSLKDCLNNHDQCRKFILMYPDHPEINKALLIMNQRCHSEESFGHNECLLLSDYFSKIGYTELKVLILVYSCTKRNPTACVRLGFIYLRNNKISKAYSYFDDLCLNPDFYLMTINDDHPFCKLTEEKSLQAQDFSTYENFPAIMH